MSTFKVQLDPTQGVLVFRVPDWSSGDLRFREKPFNLDVTTVIDYEKETCELKARLIPAEE